MIVRSHYTRSVLYFFVATCFAAAGYRLVVPGSPSAAVERAIEQERTRLQIPGLSVAIVTDHRLLCAKGYGMASLENGIPATAQTVYRLASVSKPITATAILQLAERGQLDLDAPIQRYVPSFPEKPWPITARQLLAHMGGIRTYRGDELNSTQHYEKLIDTLAIFQDDPLVSEPGTRFFYTTYGYNLLGAVIEGASGMSYVDYVRANIFELARMETIRVDDHFAIIPHRARGYCRTRSGGLRNSSMADTSNKIPGGGFCSTVVDLARFAIAVQTGRLLKPDTMQQMFTSQSTSQGIPLGYGLGWRIQRRGDSKEVWHKGAQQHVSTILYMLPEERCAVALMANLEGVDLLPLARTIADLMVGRP